MKYQLAIIMLLINSLLMGNICDICFKKLEQSYLKDAWGNKYHEKHLREGTFCNTCSRIISKRLTRGGIKFSDGRFMCNLCETHIIRKNDDKIILKSIDSVIEILRNKGININKTLFKINLIDIQTLQSSVDGVGKHSLSNLKAITILDNRKYIVNVLWGLHQLEFEGVLAHELLHVWSDYNNIKLSNAKLEGFCNIGSAFIYNNYNTELSNILLQSLEENKDPIYGDGYKYMNIIIKKYGWDEVLNRLINHNHNWLN